MLAAATRGGVCAARVGRGGTYGGAFHSPPHIPLAAVRIAPHAAVAAYSTTPTLAGGRHTTGVPERVKHWRKHISKKAEKRYKVRKERAREAAANSRGKLGSSAASAAPGSALALTAGQAAALALPTPAALARLSHDNRNIIESIVLGEETPATGAAAHAQLRDIDADALLEAHARGFLEPTLANFNYTLRVLGAQGRFEDAVSLFARMHDAGVPPTLFTFTALLTACAQQRNMGAAFQVFDALKATPGVMPNDVAYGALMQACVRAYDLPRAFQVLQSAQAEGVRLTPVLFTHLMVGCLHAGEYDRAWQVWDHMRRYHCEPDAVAYTTMINVCGKMDQVERALNLLTEMKQRGLQPTGVTYNSIIHTAGRSLRRYAHAFTLFNEMRVAGFKHDAYSYNGVLLACSQTGDVPAARKYMWQMLRDGVKPSLVTLNTVLAVYARALRKRHKPDADELAALRAEGANLLALDDAETAAADAEAVRRTKLIGDYARLIEGDEDLLVENLLADYFQDPKHPARESAEEATFENEGLMPDEEGGMTQAYLPALKTFNQDLNDPEYAAAKEYLINAGGVDRDLLAEVEADNEMYPPLDSEEEAVRMAVDDRSERSWRSRMQTNVQDIFSAEAQVAEKEARVQRKAKLLAEYLRAPLPSAGNTGTVLSAATNSADAMRTDALQRLLSGRLLFDEIVQQAGAEVGAPGDVAETPAHARFAALRKARPDGRVSFRSVMKELEAQVDVELFGADAVHGAGGDARKALPAGAQREGLVDAGASGALVAAGAGASTGFGSLFDSDGEIGGVAVKELLDITNIPVPEAGESDSDHDPIKLHDYYAQVIGKRVFEALEREYGDPAAQIDQLVSEWSDADVEDSSVHEAVSVTSDAAQVRLRGANHRSHSATAGAAGAQESATFSVDGAQYSSTSVVGAGSAHSTSAPSSDSHSISDAAQLAATESHAATRRRAAVRAAAPPSASAAASAAAHAALEATLAAVAPNSVSAATRFMFEGASTPLRGQGELESVTPSAAPLMPAAEAAAYKLDSSSDSEPGNVHANATALVERAALNPDRPPMEGMVRRRRSGRVDVRDGEFVLRPTTLAAPPPGNSTLFAATQGTDDAAVGGAAPAESATPAPQHVSDSVSEDMEAPEFPDAGSDNLSVLATVAGADVARPSSGETRSAPATHAAPALATLPPERRVVARALARLMQERVLPKLERNLVTSVESDRKLTKRADLDLKPGMLDSVFAVPALRAAIHDDTAPAAAGAGVGAGAAGSEADEGGRRTAAPSAQADARRQLAMAAKSPQFARQLSAVADVSDRVLSGAEWLPRADYPTEGKERKRVLLEEARKVYYDEMARRDMKPDIVTLNTMLTAYCNAGQNALAYEFLTTEFPRFGLQPDVRSYRALLRMHVHQRRSDRVESVLTTMRGVGVQPDQDCIGLVVHTRARDWRVKDAIAMIQEAKANGVHVSEHYAFLLRQRCKEMGIMHPDVPEHPVGWQFRPEVMKKRHSHSRVINKMAASLRPQLRGKWK